MRSPLQKVRILSVLLVASVMAVVGCNKSSDDNPTFTPVVATNTVITKLTSTTATSGGYITNFISGTITAYGVCWSSTNKTPTVADSKVSLTAANVLHFSADLTGLTANTLYYLRAYATSNDGTTIYGDVLQFSTPTATYSITGTVSTYAGNGSAAYGEGALRSASFNSPQSIVVDATGNFYVADQFNNAIRKISSTGTVSTLAGSATPGFVDGTGAAARFYSPQYLAIDGTGNLYVSDAGNNAIRKITPAGVVTTLAGGAGAGFVDATGSSAKFNNPAGLAVDASGNIYVADRGNNLIRKVTAAGVVNSFAGIRTVGYTDGTYSAAQFSSLAGMTIDSKGLLYVADAGNNAIRTISTTDGTVSTLVGNPTSLSDLLNLPVAVTIDKNNNIFIADESGRILEIVAATKALYSIAGTSNTAGYAEGAGINAQFNNPQGLAADAAGNVYIADHDNNVIRKMVITTTP